MMNQTLLDELLRIQEALDEAHIPFLLGGGMGLYLRDLYPTGRRQQAYRYRIASRTTKDIDVFLSAEVIADADRMNRLRDLLDRMDYRPVTRFFQFERQTGEGGQTVRIDLLAAPPTQELQDRVKIKPPRIQPKGVKGIHAFLTREADGIERDATSIAISHEGKEIRVRIPSSYNYLILKLHAVGDRIEKARTVPGESQRAQEEELVRHHALDIFRIVTDMTEVDWRNAIAHRDEEGREEYVRRAAEIQKRLFDHESAEGVIALQSAEIFKRDREVFAAYVPNVVRDLRELFELERGE